MGTVMSRRFNQFILHILQQSDLDGYAYPHDRLPNGSVPFHIDQQIHFTVFAVIDIIPVRKNLPLPVKSSILMIP